MGCHCLLQCMNVAHQVPLSMRFSRQEYWSGSPFPSPGDLPKPGIDPGSPVLEADALPLSHQGSQFFTFSSVQFGRSVVSDSLRPHELQHARPPCPSPTPGLVYGVAQSRTRLKRLSSSSSHVDYALDLARFSPYALFVASCISERRSGSVTSWTSDSAAA